MKTIIIIFALIFLVYLNIYYWKKCKISIDKFITLFFALLFVLMYSFYMPFNKIGLGQFGIELEKSKTSEIVPIDMTGIKWDEISRMRIK